MHELCAGQLLRGALRSRGGVGGSDDYNLTTWCVREFIGTLTNKHAPAPALREAPTPAPGKAPASAARALCVGERVEGWMRLAARQRRGLARTGAWAREFGWQMGSPLRRRGWATSVPAGGILASTATCVWRNSRTGARRSSGSGVRRSTSRTGPASGEASAPAPGETPAACNPVVFLLRCLSASFCLFETYRGVG